MPIPGVPPMQAVQPRPEIPDLQPPAIFPPGWSEVQLRALADYYQRAREMNYNRPQLQGGYLPIGQQFVDPRVGFPPAPPQGPPPQAAVAPAPRVAVTNVPRVAVARPPRAGLTRRYGR